MHILAEKRLNALVLTLNRPEKLNSLTTQMVKDLKTHFEKPGLKIIHSNHPKAYCAGGDVVSLLDDAEKGRQFFKEEYKMNMALYRRREAMDTVAIVNGICFGGGVGISAHAPYVVTTEQVRYGMPETKIGLHPDVGGSFFLPRYKGGVGLLLGLTGYNVRSPWLLREIGYATHYVPAQRIQHLINELGNTASLDAVQGILSEFAETPEVQDADLRVMEVANDCFLNQSLEDIFEALAEKENCKLCKELLKSMEAASPMSLALTHKLYHLKASTLAQALRNEYRVSSRLLQKDSDFHIGVNQLLVKKSKEPVKWQHKSVSDISKSEIDAYLAPVADEFE